MVEVIRNLSQLLPQNQFVMNYKINFSITFLLLIILGAVSDTRAQCDNRLAGPATISASQINQDVQYSVLRSFLDETYAWSIQGDGQIIAGANAATVTVRWTGSGTHTITLIRTIYLDMGGLPIPHQVINCLEVTVEAPNLSPPTMIDGYGTCNPLTPIVMQVANPVSGVTYRWYSSELGGIFLNQGTTYSRQFLTQSTTYYVSAYLNGFESTRTPVTAHVIIAPEPTVSLSEFHLCEGHEELLLRVDDPMEAPYTTNWYNAAGDLVATGRRLRLDYPSTSVYYVANQYPGFNCESERIQVTIDIHNPQVALVPLNATGNSLIDETSNIITAVTAEAGTDQPVHYWVNHNSFPIADANKVSSIPQSLQSGESIDLYALEHGCWSSPVTYTAVGGSNLDMNWTLNKVFDGDGKAIGETKTFYDNRGLMLQTQVKSFESQKTFTSQPIYDYLDRSAIQTLSAPKSTFDLEYQDNFVTTQGGQQYTEDKFGQPLDKTTPGTLGWYYSQNNTWEDLTPRSDFPYSRMDART